MRLSEIKKAVWATDLQPYMYQTKTEIEEWIKRLHFKGFVNKELEIEPADSQVDLGRIGVSTTQDNITIDVNGKHLLPVQFKLAVNFDTGHKILLNSFIGCPRVVLQNFKALRMEVSDLEGFPKHIGSDVHIFFYNSNLHNLEGFSEHCGKNVHLRNSSDDNSKIHSIAGISEEVKDLTIGCKFSNIKEIVQLLPDLEGLWLINPEMSDRPGFLQVFKLKKITNKFYTGMEFDDGSDYDRATKIIRSHLEGERDIMDCQEELFAAGLKDFGRM